MSLLGRAGGLARRLAVVTLSVGVRGVFGLVLAGIIVGRYPAAFSVEFFQLLLLQSIFMTFVSGSGYAHAVAVSRTDAEARSVVRNYLAFVVIAVAAALIGEAILPRALVARVVSPDRWKINLLMLGGVAISLHGILQGVVIARIGAFRTFLPTSLAGLAATLALVLLPKAPAATMFGVFVGYQVGSLALLVVSSPTAARLLIGALRLGEEPINPIASASVFAVATVNTVFLLVFFAFRDWWSGRVPAVDSQGAFFGLRLSDTYLQIVAFSAAQANPFRLTGHEPSRRFALGLGGAAALSAGALLAVLGVLAAPVQVPLIARCVVAQVLCEAVRLPASLTTMARLQAGSAVRYALTSLPPMLLAFAAAALVARPTGLAAIYVFQIAAAGLQIASFCAIGLADARRRLPALA